MQKSIIKFSNIYVNYDTKECQNWSHLELKFEVKIDTQKCVKFWCHFELNFGGQKLTQKLCQILIKFWAFFWLFLWPHISPIYISSYEVSRNAVFAKLRKRCFRYIFRVAKCSTCPYILGSKKGSKPEKTVFSRFLINYVRTGWTFWHPKLGKKCCNFVQTFHFFRALFWKFPLFFVCKKAQKTRFFAFPRKTGNLGQKVLKNGSKKWHFWGRFLTPILPPKKGSKKGSKNDPKNGSKKGHFFDQFWGQILGQNLT